MKRNAGIKDILLVLLGAAAVVAVWAIAAAAYGRPFVLPSPSDALKALADELAAKYFWKSFALTLLRGAVSFAAALILALAYALLCALYPPLRRVLAPVTGVLRALPTMSVILLLVLWTDSRVTPVIVSGLVIFPVLCGGLSGAIGALPSEYGETARLYGVNRLHVFFTVSLPLAAPDFMYTAAGAASLSIKLTVAAEVLAQTKQSIGLMMQQTRIYFEIGRLMALTLAVVAASLFTELVFYAVRKKIEY